MLIRMNLTSDEGEYKVVKNIFWAELKFFPFPHRRYEIRGTNNTLKSFSLENIKFDIMANGITMKWKLFRLEIPKKMSC